MKPSFRRLLNLGVGPLAILYGQPFSGIIPRSHKLVSGIGSIVMAIASIFVVKGGGSRSNSGVARRRTSLRIADGRQCGFIVMAIEPGVAWAAAHWLDLGDNRTSAAGTSKDVHLRTRSATI